jgi:hypothetical protein
MTIGAIIKDSLIALSFPSPNRKALLSTITHFSTSYNSGKHPNAKFA